MMTVAVTQTDLKKVARDMGVETDYIFQLIHLSKQLYC